MPFIQAPIAEAREDELVPEAEYDLVIAGVEEKDSKKGDPMLQIAIDIENPPDGVSNPQSIFHYISLPTDHDEPKTSRYKLKMLRRFLEVFNIPFEDGGFDTDDLQGAKGSCLVYQQEIMRDEKSTGEYMHAIRLPKFANEVTEEDTAAKPRRRRG